MKNFVRILWIFSSNFCHGAVWFSSSRAPPSRHTSHERARQHTIFTRWFTAYTTHDENLAKAFVQLTPKTLSTTGQNISFHPVFQFGAKNGFKITQGTYNVMARAWWASMFHISRNKFRKRPMPSWVWPPVTIRNGVHIHVINSWFEPKKINQSLFVFAMTFSRQTQKNALLRDESLLEKQSIKT